MLVIRGIKCAQELNRADLTRQIVEFVITIILARILVSNDFGAVVSLAIFMGLDNLLVSADLSMA